MMRIAWLFPATAALAVMACNGGRGENAGVLNHLKGQKSPYLIEHSTNPVDWYPWGDEAFQKAKKEDRPIFLSIGYSSCHWCHVMEKESFENPQVAVLMNEVFVSIKVDREERPDLDEHFMTVSQTLTGGGGWPLTVIMTPDKKPFFAATYIPRETAFGRLGLVELIPRIREYWNSRRMEIEHSADAIAIEVGRSAADSRAGFAIDPHAMKTALQALARGYDRRNGGFGAAPKFPMPTVFPLLLRAWSREGDSAALAMAEESLTRMRNGGVFDQLGFGFHRYSTDSHWLVPHFEKMLYDQALLVIAYTDAWQATGSSSDKMTAEETLTYVRRDLVVPGGGFATAEDADSEGIEGKFYLWTTAEIRDVLGGQAGGFIARYGGSDAGNVAGLDGVPSGENILHRDPAETSPPGAQEAQLLAARGKRARPFRDDKVLTDWNGLMIAALARAGSAFDDPSMIDSARGAAQFVLERLQSRGGRLLHRYRDGEASIPAFADDYAFLAWGLLELYEATFDPRYLEQAIGLMDVFVTHFWDTGAGGFFETADDAPNVLARGKVFADGALPSANFVGLILLLKLNRITGNIEYERRAETLLRLYPSDAASDALGYPFFLCAADFSAGPSREVVIAGDRGAEDTRRMLRAIRTHLLPNMVVILRPMDSANAAILRLAPFVATQVAIGGKATAYVCTNFVCNLPTNDVGVMLRELDAR